MGRSHFDGAETWTRDQTTLASGIWRAIADLISAENVIGTNGIDDLRGDDDNNIFVYRGTSAIPGVDQINGRGGTDTVDFSAFVSAVWVDLTFDGNEVWTQDERTLTGEPWLWREIAHLTSVETLIGSSYDDVLRGDEGDNTLIGGAGFDAYGFADGFGRDVIVGFNFDDAEKIDLSRVTAITSFDDLMENHLRTDPESGFVEIFDGPNAVLVDRYRTQDFGIGNFVSEDDFIF